MQLFPAFHRAVLTLSLLGASFLGLTTPIRADNVALSTIGINDHLTRYSDYNSACDDIIASGIKWVRIAPEWGSLEPSSGAFDNAALARVDAIVDRLTSHGVNVVFDLCYTAPWASSNPTSANASRYKPANWSDWQDYVSFITNRYTNKIFYWEVWNEPDNAGFWKNSAADYVTLLQYAGEQIRASNSANKVVLGGLALNTGTADSYGPGTFFDTILALGAGSWFDIINYHAYGDSAHYVALNGGMQAVINSYGLQSRKIWLTETGYTTVGDSAREATKADMVDQSYWTHTGLNIERIFWYLHRADATGNASEDNYGLMRNDRTPLQAFYYFDAVNGAETDFKLQKEFPSLVANRRSLYYVPAPAGDGSFVVDYSADGSTKRIPAGKYMYCAVNDNWLFNGNDGLDSKIYVDVTYLNSDTGTWGLHYDANTNAYYGVGMGRTKSNSAIWLTETFTLSDAKFANRENNAADFRIYAGNADLIVSSVRVRKQMNYAALVLRSTDRFRLLERPNETNPALEAYNPIATIGGRECRQIGGNNKFIYIKVCDGVARAGNANVNLTLDFWDSGTDNLLVQYNATSGAYKNCYIAKTNTNGWRTVTLPLNDANFVNAQNYKADFRISNGLDNSVEYIDHVEVTRY